MKEGKKEWRWGENERRGAKCSRRFLWSAHAVLSVTSELGQSTSTRLQARETTVAQGEQAATKRRYSREGGLEIRYSLSVRSSTECETTRFALLRRWRVQETALWLGWKKHQLAKRSVKKTKNVHSPRQKHGLQRTTAAAFDQFLAWLKGERTLTFLMAMSIISYMYYSRMFFLSHIFNQYFATFTYQIHRVH